MEKFLRVGLILFVVFGFSEVRAAEPARTVSVSGTCLRYTVPDRGVVTLVAQAREADSKHSQTAAQRQYEVVRSKILALHLPDAFVTTSEYSTEEVREWQKDHSVSKGFRTRIGLRVETSDQARLGEVLEIATRESLTEVGGMRAFVSSRKALEEKVACLKEAAENARVKAESLAKALGAQIGEVVSIQENPGPDTPEPSPPMPMLKAAMAEDRTAPVIEPGRTEISTTIQASFRLR